MRSAFLMLGALLAACTTTAPAVHGRAPGGTCNAEGTDGFIGQSGTSETGAAIMRATRSSILRWAPPGYMLTMDFSPSRVTVRLDAAYKVISVSCG